jgi:hypothetical protein
MLAGQASPATQGGNLNLNEERDIGATKSLQRRKGELKP